MCVYICTQSFCTDVQFNLNLLMCDYYLMFVFLYRFDILYNLPDVEVNQFFSEWFFLLLLLFFIRKARTYVISMIVIVVIVSVYIFCLNLVIDQCMYVENIWLFTILQYWLFVWFILFFSSTYSTASHCTWHHFF